MSIPRIYLTDAVENKEPNSNKAAKFYHQAIIVNPDGSEEKALLTDGVLIAGKLRYTKNKSDWVEDAGFIKRWFGWLA